MRRMVSPLQNVTSRYGGNVPVTFFAGRAWPSNLYSPKKGRVSLSGGCFSSMQGSGCGLSAFALGSHDASLPIEGDSSDQSDPYGGNVNGDTHPAPYQHFGKNPVCYLDEEDLLDVVGYIASKEDCFVNRCAMTGVKKPRYRAPAGCEYMWASLEDEMGINAHYLIEVYLANQHLIGDVMSRQEDARQASRPVDELNNVPYPQQTQVVQQVAPPQSEDVQSGSGWIKWGIVGAGLYWLMSR